MIWNMFLLLFLPLKQLSDFKEKISSFKDRKTDNTFGMEATVPKWFLFVKIWQSFELFNRIVSKLFFYK